ncbi:PREDICTED: nuclear pore complex protein Nup50 [Nicrophorus vespilloides]|uniref:Nuclear pore complex protein Nup50 n=1 Tax=Nicrophorus vespilloides TaxID=110193 RepID=A0ABM1MZH3_NICVS|nr:PREDICTED: nuclear pore complex protein Nup50 [Nicrophorus vespilloides]
MAGKRSATSELNHDNWDQEDECEDAGTFKRASEDVLKKRVIKTARRRGVAPTTTKETDNGEEKKSVFGGFTAFNKAQTNPNAAFAFLKQDVNGTDKEVIKPVETPKKEPNNEYLAKLKGLNESVSSWIKTHVDENPFIDLRPIFGDYERYFKEIETTKVKVSEETKKELSSFTFQTPAKEDKSQLTFGSNKKPEESKPQFSFGNNQNNNNSKESAPQFSFGSGSKDEKVTKPQFSFGSTNNKEAETKTGQFSFNSNSKEKEEQKPQFSFGSNSKEESKPQFSFGTPKKQESSKPEFKFGATNTANENKDFSFGSSKDEQDKKGFTFGSASNNFSFGAVTSTPFAAANNVTKPAVTTEKSEEAEEDEPPKVEFTPVVEDNSVYSIRCKVFVKKDGAFGDRGVGNLFLKPVPDSEKVQLIVRADTNLGNLLCNFILSDGIPMQRLGKKDVMLVCLPVPDAKPPPTPILFRVKSSEDADELLKTLEKHKK